MRRIAYENLNKYSFALTIIEDLIKKTATLKSIEVIVGADIISDM